VDGVSVIRSLCQIFKFYYEIVLLYASQIVPNALFYVYKYVGNFPIFLNEIYYFLSLKEHSCDTPLIMIGSAHQLN
jgi:hypothetical protein